jgi:BACON domain-containing protein
MHQCEFCGSEIPNNATFCGQCGRAPGNMIEAQTRVSGLHMPDVQDADTASDISVPGTSTPHWEYNQQSSNVDMPTAPLSQEEEEEEERRRRAAMLGIGIPLLGNLAVEGQPYAGNVPMVQGTPQMGGVPTVQGTPQLGSVPPTHFSPHLPGSSMGPGFHSSPTAMAPQIPDTTTTLHHPHHPHHPHPTHHEPQGCGPLFIIAAISIPVLIILSFIGLGLTVFAPGLSLSGSAGVEQGGTFTLHGSHFIPGSSVTLTLDDTIPLYFTSHNSPVQPAYIANASTQVLGMDLQQMKQAPLSSNTVSVGGDGTFDVTITASSSWSIGKHTIKASESLTHRSANLDFTIYQAGTTPTPFSTGTASPSPTASITPTTTATPPGLSCVNPSSLSFGPVSQGYNQPVSASVTLCTIGTGTVNWTATWDQNAAPWLKLDHTSGQISAPGQTQVNVSALAPTLTPGSYSVILTFASQPNNVTESLPVSFTVQAGCINGTRNALTYSGVANVTDPAPQTVAITNCGPPGAWYASAQTSDGANWLSASPTANTLNAGATTNVTIAASNLKAQLKAGTYTGTVTFKIGSGIFTVGVRLTVVPTPILSVTPTIIYANQCTSSTVTTWICSVTLTNTSTAASLNWTATSSTLKGVSFNPSRGTLLPGHSVPVKITFPKSDCPTAKGTLTFTGPGNTVTVVVTC